MMRTKNNWKYIGLLVSLSLELLFWVLYLSGLLVKVGSPLGDVLWLSSGIAGIIFGIINLFGCQKKHIEVLSKIALITGIILLPLWVLAMFVANM
jgi:hypothetical protein